MPPCYTQKDYAERYLMLAIWRTYDANPKNYWPYANGDLRAMTMITFDGMREEIEEKGLSFEVMKSFINTDEFKHEKFRKAACMSIRKDRPDRFDKIKKPQPGLC